MSPAGLALALTLHALAIAALYWMPSFKIDVVRDEGIDVTLEQAAGTPAPPPQPEAKPQVQPEAPQPAEPPPQPQQAEPPPAPQPSPEPPPQPQQQSEAPAPPTSDPPLARPEPPRPPEPRVEQALPPPEPPPPPPTAMDFPKPAPPSPPPPPPKPLVAQPRPPPKPTPQPAPQQRPPANNQATVLQPSPLRAPSDVLIGPGAAGDRADYFTSIVRRTAQYRYYPKSSRDAGEEGRVVMRITIARDGRLLDVRIEQSSGYPALDAAEMETVRRASPYPPLPANVAGDRSTFLVPVTYELRDPRQRL